MHKYEDLAKQKVNEEDIVVFGPSDVSRLLLVFSHFLKLRKTKNIGSKLYNSLCNPTGEAGLLTSLLLLYGHSPGIYDKVIPCLPHLAAVVTRGNCTFLVIIIKGVCQVKETSAVL